jgi:hypothetical protein
MFVCGSGGRPAVKNLRCLLGMHTWQKKQIEDSQFFQCRRCGRDRPGNHLSANPWGASAGGAG